MACTVHRFNQLIKSDETKLFLMISRDEMDVVDSFEAVASKIFKKKWAQVVRTSPHLGRHRTLTI